MTGVHLGRMFAREFKEGITVSVCVCVSVCKRYMCMCMRVHARVWCVCVCACVLYSRDVKVNYVFGSIK